MVFTDVLKIEGEKADACRPAAGRSEGYGD